MTRSAILVLCLASTALSVNTSSEGGPSPKSVIPVLDELLLSASCGQEARIPIEAIGMSALADQDVAERDRRVEAKADELWNKAKKMLLLR